MYEKKKYLKKNFQTESEVAEMPSRDQANRGKNLVWFFREIERKLAKLSMTTFTYCPSSYLFYAPSPLWFLFGVVKQLDQVGLGKQTAKTWFGLEKSCTKEL
jgi:hypothetical protein